MDADDVQSKKRCWVVVGDVVRLKSDASQIGAVVRVNAGAFATWVDVLWSDGLTSTVPIETVTPIVDVDDAAR